MIFVHITVALCRRLWIAQLTAWLILNYEGFQGLLIQRKLHFYLMRLISDFCISMALELSCPFMLKSLASSLFSVRPNCGLVFSPTKMYVMILNSLLKHIHGCSVIKYLPPDLCHTLLWLWLQRVPSALLKGLGHLCSSWHKNSNMCCQGQLLLLAVISKVLFPK